MKIITSFIVILEQHYLLNLMDEKGTNTEFFFLENF
jgi:hypothetical protein